MFIWLLHRVPAGLCYLLYVTVWTSLWPRHHAAHGRIAPDSLFKHHQLLAPSSCRSVTVGGGRKWSVWNRMWGRTYLFILLWKPQGLRWEAATDDMHGQKQRGGCCFFILCIPVSAMIFLNNKKKFQKQHVRQKHLQETASGNLWAHDFLCSVGGKQLNRTN